MWPRPSNVDHCAARPTPFYFNTIQMTSSTVFDVIVVGAGVEGSATAYQLIKNGAKRVLLLEQVSIV